MGTGDKRIVTIMSKKAKDFVFSFVLAALGIYVAINSFMLYKRVAGPPYRIERFSISPGFLPFILGVLLFFFSVLLFIGSVKGEKGFSATFKENGRGALTWFKESVVNRDYLFTIGGIVIMFIYSFILMSFLPFWISSLIFLLALFFYLNAGKWWKSIIVAVLAIALIVIVFQYCFNAALP